MKVSLPIYHLLGRVFLLGHWGNDHPTVSSVKRLAFYLCNIYNLQAGTAAAPLRPCHHAAHPTRTWVLPLSFSVSASSSAVLNCWSRMAASAERSWRCRSSTSPWEARSCQGGEGGEGRHILSQVLNRSCLPVEPLIGSTSRAVFLWNLMTDSRCGGGALTSACSSCTWLLASSSSFSRLACSCCRPAYSAATASACACRRLTCGVQEGGRRQPRQCVCVCGLHASSVFGCGFVRD